MQHGSWGIFIFILVKIRLKFCVIASNCDILFENRLATPREQDVGKCWFTALSSVEKIGPRSKSCTFWITFLILLINLFQYGPNVLCYTGRKEVYFGGREQREWKSRVRRVSCQECFSEWWQGGQFSIDKHWQDFLQAFPDQPFFHQRCR